MFNRHTFSVAFGTAFYNGDVNYDPVFGRTNRAFSDIKNDKGATGLKGSLPGFSARLGHHYIPKFLGSSNLIIQTELAYAFIHADDLYELRNLDFQTHTFGLQSSLVYELGGGLWGTQSGKRIVPYVGLGVGAMYFTPHADLLGEDVKLDGDYSNIAFYVPGTVGIKYRISAATSVGLETSYLLTFTDGLDDVYGGGYDPASPSSDRSPGNVASKNNYQRGGDANDGIALINIRFQFVLPGNIL